MNKAERAIISQYLATAAEYAELPYGLTVKDIERRDREISGRLIDIAGDAAFIAGAPADGMPGEDSSRMSRRMEGATSRMRKRMAEPLPYTPEPPEFADSCVCGNRRGEHLGADHDGIWVLAKSYPDKYKCPGFTLATSDERKAS